MSIQVDRRTIDARRIEGATRTLKGMAGELLEIELRLARLLARIEETGHYELEGCASTVEYAARAGIARSKALALCDLGRALRGHADLERALREGQTDTERAGIASRILVRPEMVQPGDDWVAHACHDTVPALRRRVKARIDEFAQQATGVVEISVHVREETKREFLRAREIASRKERVVLTHGQTFHRVVRFYLDRNDPLRRSPGKRRVPDTRDVPRSRYVPADVMRAVYERSGGQCEFPGCQHRIFLEFGHIVPHAQGSGREADDFFHFCSRHHTLYDAKLIRFVGGTVESPIFWVKGVGTVSAEQFEGFTGDGPERARTEVSEDALEEPAAGSPDLPAGKGADTGDQQPPPLLAERGTAIGGTRAYPLFDTAIVHC